MLVLTLQRGSKTQVSGSGTIHIVEVRGNSVRVGFEDSETGQLNVLREDAKNKMPRAGREARQVK